MAVNQLYIGRRIFEKSLLNDLLRPIHKANIITF